jgi:hypothetical protein
MNGGRVVPVYCILLLRYVVIVYVHQSYNVEELIQYISLLQNLCG